MRGCSDALKFGINSLHNQASKWTVVIIAMWCWNDKIMLSVMRWIAWSTYVFQHNSAPAAALAKIFSYCSDLGDRIY